MAARCATLMGLLLAALMAFGGIHQARAGATLDAVKKRGGLIYAPALH